MTELDPIVGNWYDQSAGANPFLVVDVDDDESLIEVEYFDGTLDQLSMRDWYELDLELCEPPEDWTGPVDALERDDLSYSETAMGPDWLRRRPVPDPTDLVEEESERADEQEFMEQGPTLEEPWEES